MKRDKMPAAKDSLERAITDYKRGRYEQARLEAEAAVRHLKALELLDECGD